MAHPPLVSVVTPTRNRAAQLRCLLQALEAQDEPRHNFEVIVVNDASVDDTESILDDHRERLPLTTLRNRRAEGPGGARNAGVALARAPLVAFVDDDCRPEPGWLRAFVEAHRASPNSILQGPVGVDAGCSKAPGPFSRVVVVTGPGMPFQTVNIAYPRALLQRLGGFDIDRFRWAGEDSDLALRAIASGADFVWVPGARGTHAVLRLGPFGKLRAALRWTEVPGLFARHPAARKTLRFGVFWRKSHYLLVRALAALLVPRRLWPLRRWLAGAYFEDLFYRGRTEGGGILVAPYFVLHDLVETGALVVGSVRSRTLVI